MQDQTYPHLCVSAFVHSKCAPGSCRHKEEGLRPKGAGPLAWLQLLAPPGVLLAHRNPPMELFVPRGAAPVKSWASRSRPLDVLLIPGLCRVHCVGVGREVQGNGQGKRKQKQKCFIWPKQGPSPIIKVVGLVWEEEPLSRAWTAERHMGFLGPGL